MRAKLWKAHQWLGVITCLGVLLWGLSGVMHPIMSRLQPKPAVFMPPPVSWQAQQAPDPVALLGEQGVTQVLSLHSVVWQGRPHWLAHTDLSQAGVMLDAASGAVVPEGERLLAQALARHHTGLHDVPVRRVRLITAFDAEYLSVNRLLPVWAVQFERDDGLTAYIDTRQMRLATLSDDTRQTLGAVFRFAHNWNFLDNWPWVQKGLMSAALLAAALSAVSGLYFWWVMRRSAGARLAQQPIKRWHRRLGLVVALTSITFAGSGAFHLWVKVLRQDVAAAPGSAPLRALDQLAGHPWHAVQSLGLIGRVELVEHGGSLAWWVHPAGQGGPRSQVAALAQAAQAESKQASGEHAHHEPATGGAARPAAPPRRAQPTLVDAQARLHREAAAALALALASHHSGMPLQALGTPQLITKFEGEYGFLNKRLPVWRVQAQAPGNPRYYVELGTGALAARVDDLGAFEGYVFSVLHKWHVGDMPKDLRDVLSATFALGNVVVALMGLTMFLRRQRRLKPV